MLWKTVRHNGILTHTSEGCSNTLAIWELYSGHLPLIKRMQGVDDMRRKLTTPHNDAGFWRYEKETYHTSQGCKMLTIWEGDLPHITRMQATLWPYGKQKKWKIHPCVPTTVKERVTEHEEDQGTDRLTIWTMYSHTDSHWLAQLNWYLCENYSSSHGLAARSEP